MTERQGQGNPTPETDPISFNRALVITAGLLLGVASGIAEIDAGIKIGKDSKIMNELYHSGALRGIHNAEEEYAAEAKERKARKLLVRQSRLGVPVTDVEAMEKAQQYARRS